MKQFLLLFILILLSNPTKANSLPIALGSVAGIVMDSEFEEPIPYATISILNAAGEIVLGTVSSAEGSFNIMDVPEGAYTLKVQFMGFEPSTREIQISATTKDLNLGTIFLKPAVAELDDVTVVAETSSIEQRIDRRVVNVGKDLTSTGASAADIMNNIPSVSVDLDGNLSLRGNQNVRVLVDGKPSNVDPATLLKQIPSSSIKQIELITNPSAKYNPEGMSGIINIILHKNTNMGFNGDVNGGLTIGKHLHSNAGLNLNYREGRFNFYTNLGISDRTWMQEIELLNHTTNSGEYMDFESPTTSYLTKIGVDFHLNDKNIFSLYTNQNFYNEDFNSTSQIRYFNDPTRNFMQSTVMDQKTQSITYNFDYRHLFDENGHELEFEIDYNKYNNEDEAQFTYENTNMLLPYQDDTQKEFHNTIINLDYVLPIGENAKLEAGAESRIRRSENDYVTTNNQLRDIFYTYNSDIHSLYTSFGQTIGKWNYQLGARLENFSTEAVEGGEEIYSDERWTLYPSAFVTFTPGEKNSFQASYSRRVDRPSLNQVSPIRQVSTPRLTISGNPELEPQFTNSMEFNYTRKLGKHSVTAGIFYRFINNDINQIMEVDPQNPEHFILTFHNTEDNTSFGTEVSARLKPASFWDINMDFNLYSQTLKGVLAEANVEEDNTFWRLQAHNSFRVSPSLRLQLMGMYMSEMKTLQFQIEDMYFVNLGARYNFWQDKASLSVNVNDVLNSQRQRLYAEIPQVQEGNFNWDSRTVYIGFSYRFGQNKARALQRRNRDSGTLDEGGIF